MSERGGSSVGGDFEDDYGFNVGGHAALTCMRCHSSHVKVLESSMICAECGFEFDNHAFNATLEYNDIAKGKASKMKREDVREKPDHISPKKLSDLRKNA
jgi:ribosomal protein L37AE/L43A